MACKLSIYYMMQLLLYAIALAAVCANSTEDHCSKPGTCVEPASAGNVMMQIQHGRSTDTANRTSAIVSSMQYTSAGTNTVQFTYSGSTSSPSNDAWRTGWLSGNKNMQLYVSEIILQLDTSWLDSSNCNAYGKENILNEIRDATVTSLTVNYRTKKKSNSWRNWQTMSLSDFTSESGSCRPQKWKWGHDGGATMKTLKATLTCLVGWSWDLEVYLGWKYYGSWINNWPTCKPALSFGIGVKVTENGNGKSAKTQCFYYTNNGCSINKWKDSAATCIGYVFDQHMQLHWR